MQYVSLHHHTTFSYGDGFGLPKEHVQFVANSGGKALALTEHGNLSSCVQLEKACKESEIKAIFGCEIYLAPPRQIRKCHQTVLAMNQQGLVNLNKMVTQSWKDFYRWPTVHMNYLEEFSDGLIVFSGCADSTLACTLLGGKSFGDKRDEYTKEQYQDCVDLIEWYKGVFGDRYYIETQNFPELDRTRALNTAFERLSQDTGVPIVATHDCHTVYDRDSEMRKILHAANRGSSVSKVEAEWEYSVPCGIPDDDNKIYDRLVQTGLSDDFAEQAILNTGLIADRCNVVLPKVEPIKYKPTESDWTEPWV